jgi:hypothetical protein
MKAPRHIDSVEAQRLRLRCVCGHARSAHRSCEHLHYRLGACKKESGTIIVEIDGTESRLLCGCQEYRPVRPT